MAEEKPSLHIDLDWKKQAQEDKRRLEEEEKRRAEERAAAAAAPAAPMAVVPSAGEAAAKAAGGSAAAPGGKSAGRARGAREIPPASIGTLAQSLATQSLYYLGDAAAARPGSEVANMDMAKHLIDTLGVLEEKTAGHLSAEEQAAIDLALYETRMRFIAVAGQVISGS